MSANNNEHTATPEQQSEAIAEIWKELEWLRKELERLRKEVERLRKELAGMSGGSCCGGGGGKGPRMTGKVLAEILRALTKLMKGGI